MQPNAWTRQERRPRIALLCRQGAVQQVYGWHFQHLLPPPECPGTHEPALFEPGHRVGWILQPQRTPSQHQRTEPRGPAGCPPPSREVSQPDHPCQRIRRPIQSSHARAARRGDGQDHAFRQRRHDGAQGRGRRSGDCEGDRCRQARGDEARCRPGQRVLHGELLHHRWSRNPLHRLPAGMHQEVPLLLQPRNPEDGRSSPTSRVRHVLRRGRLVGWQVQGMAAAQRRRNHAFWRRGHDPDRIRP
mmetsp:Transcript_22441/g.62620  ORF Transcript_22441/g.62620 Transcript_22441/m.62620 type:complete len:245 (+) Transcript_22441:1566-2300(+)